MPDIAKCAGTDCPVKEKCFRFTAKPSEFRQSYFSNAPGKLEGNKFTCTYYWGKNAQSIWNQLNDIVNGKENE